MDARPEKTVPIHDARALPAPPLALWLFAAILTASVVWAAVLA